MDRPSTSSSGHRQAKFLNDDIKGDSRYLNNRHLIRKRVIFGSICIVVFTLGLLLGAFSSRTLNRNNANQEFGICRLEPSEDLDLDGILEVERYLNHFSVNGTLKVKASSQFFIRLEESGNASNCSKASPGGTPIPVKQPNVDTVSSWKSSEVTGNYLLGRVLKVCSQLEFCACCIVARTD